MKKIRKVEEQDEEEVKKIKKKKRKQRIGDGRERGGLRGSKEDKAEEKEGGGE